MGYKFWYDIYVFEEVIKCLLLVLFVWSLGTRIIEWKRRRDYVVICYSLTSKYCSSNKAKRTHLHTKKYAKGLEEKTKIL